MLLNQNYLLLFSILFYVKIAETLLRTLFWTLSCFVKSTKVIVD